VVDGGRVGAVELVLRSQGVAEVRGRRPPQALRRVALLPQVARLLCTEI